MSITTWSTIHIFGYGEVQVIGKDADDKNASVKKATSEVQAETDALLDNLFTKKPVDNQSVKEEYHVVHLFNAMDARFAPKGSGVEGFSVKTSELDQLLIDNLVKAVSA